MNIIKRILFYVQTMLFYLRGCRLFQEGNYLGAINNFEKCLRHPEFNNELIFSYYKQALCAAGSLDEGRKHLLKACQIYEGEGWVFQEEFNYNLAKNTIDALKHTNEWLGTDTGNEYLDKKLVLNKNKLPNSRIKFDICCIAAF